MLDPIPPKQWSPELRPILDQLGTPLNIHSVIAHNPTLLQAYTPLRFHIVRDSKLTLRQRELLVLRIAHSLNCDYEWAQHVKRGQQAGLSLDEIERVRTTVGFSDDEVLLMTCADEMIGNQKLSEQLAADLHNQFGADGLLDILFTIGIYIIMGTILNTFDTPIDVT